MRVMVICFAKRIKLSDWKMVMPATSDLQEQQPDERFQIISEFIDHMINDEICLPIIAIERKGTSVLRTFARGEQVLSENRLGNDRKEPVLGHDVGPKDITGWVKCANLIRSATPTRRSFRKCSQRCKYSLFRREGLQKGRPDLA